jgi:hypothetical protein
MMLAKKMTIESVIKTPLPAGGDWKKRICATSTEK